VILDHALTNGVAFVPGHAFYADPAGESELRLCFSSVLPGSIDEAIRKLAVSLQGASRAPRAELIATA
jgi:DNA-binding transcriptional MocR family regulator